jgi:hypothetical protein
VPAAAALVHIVTSHLHSTLALPALDRVGAALSAARQWIILPHARSTPPIPLEAAVLRCSQQFAAAVGIHSARVWEDREGELVPYAAAASRKVLQHRHGDTCSRLTASPLATQLRCAAKAQPPPLNRSVK